jgi:hypothetical protein
MEDIDPILQDIEMGHNVVIERDYDEWRDLIPKRKKSLIVFPNNKLDVIIEDNIQNTEMMFHTIYSLASFIFGNPILNVGELDRICMAKSKQKYNNDYEFILIKNAEHFKLEELLFLRCFVIRCQVVVIWDSQAILSVNEYTIAINLGLYTSKRLLKFHQDNVPALEYDCNYLDILPNLPSFTNFPNLFTDFKPNFYDFIS